MDLPKNEYLSYCIVNYLATYYGIECSNANEWRNAIEWLSVSSNLESVIISPSKFDDGLLYCGNAWDYAKSKCELHSELSMELLRFHFAWGALESLTNAFVPAKKITEHGRINALCGYLKTCKLQQFLPICYLDEYEHLVAMLRTAGEYQDELIKLNMNTETKYGYKNYVDSAGIGIYVVYQVRNKFAHGAMQLPEPEEYSGEYVGETKLIEVATRIVLMTILILLISDIKDKDFFLDDIGENVNYSALEYLQNLCTLKAGNYKDQFSLHEFTEKTYEYSSF